MSVEKLTERILLDANEEAETILLEAQTKAEKILAEATARAEVIRVETESEVAEKRKSILEKRAAAARLDSAKILLKEKRGVIDAIYEKALDRLIHLSEEDSVRLLGELLIKYAEEGDEILFAQNFPYTEEVISLPVVHEKKLKVAEERIAISGGVRLRGQYSDKDLSYGTLLQIDRENHQASIAAELFK